MSDELEIVKRLRDGSTFLENRTLGEPVTAGILDEAAALRAALEEITRRTKVYIDRLSDYGGQDDRTVSALGELCNAHNEARRALTEA